MVEKRKVWQKRNATSRRIAAFSLVPHGSPNPAAIQVAVLDRLAHVLGLQLARPVKSATVRAIFKTR